MDCKIKSQKVYNFLRELHSATRLALLDTRCVRSIFREVHAPAKNVFELFFVMFGEKLCEAYYLFEEVSVHGVSRKFHIGAY